VRNGWTGGQYSLFRAVFGVYLTLVFLDVLLEPGAAGSRVASLAGIGASLAFAIGYRDRGAAVLILAAGGALGAIDSGTLGPGAVLSAWILVLHGFLPAAPYGSLDAIGRIDPGNGWRMHDVVHTAHWIALAVALVGLGIVVWHPDWGEKWRLLPEIVARGPRATVLAVLTLAVAPLALMPRLRRFAWVAAAAAAALGVALAVDERPFLGLAALLFVAFEPAWIAPKEPAACDLVFFDGTCGLCHRAIRFVLAEDERRDRFRFAPLGSGPFLEHVDARVRTDLPDSIVVLASDGSLHTRSAATVRIGRRLGGLWRVLAGAIAIVPLPLRDLVYDGVARSRRAIFARPEASCPVLPPSLRRRFLDGVSEPETR
jgi:predicted DCC family thiol-disulfide oxidoreductase YuxK